MKTFGGCNLARIAKYLNGLLSIPSLVMSGTVDETSQGIGSSFQLWCSIYVAGRYGGKFVKNGARCSLRILLEHFYLLEGP